jgi:hypothetical protein
MLCIIWCVVQKLDGRLHGVQELKFGSLVTASHSLQCLLQTLRKYSKSSKRQLILLIILHALMSVIFLDGYIPLGTQHLEAIVTLCIQSPLRPVPFGCKTRCMHTYVLSCYAC